MKTSIPLSNRFSNRFLPRIKPFGSCLTVVACLFALSGANAEQPLNSVGLVRAPDEALTMPAAFAGAFVAWEHGSREANLRLWEDTLKRSRSSVPALDFYGQKTWADMKTFDWLPSFWLRANPERKIVWSMPLSFEGTPLSEIADGRRDDAFGTAAKAIAAAQPDAVIRIGWEMNVDGSEWSAVGRERDYIRAYRRVVTIFRRFSPAFRFDWCPGWGLQAGPADKAYPGDDVVDYIGLDVYDYDTGKSVERRWTEDTLNAPFGLEWHRTFAKRHGKKMSYPEWGAGQAGDNSYFVQKMSEWFVANQAEIAYALYFNVDAAWPSRLDAGALPQAWSVFRTRFMGRAR